MSMNGLVGALRSADKNGNKYVLYPMTKIELIEGLRDELDSLEVTKTAAGEVMVVGDSAELPFMGLNVFGKSTQNTTTGKNLLENVAVTKTEGGVTFTVNDDGSVKVNGTSTAAYHSQLIINTITLDVGSYIISGCPSGGSSDSYRLVCIDSNSIHATIVDAGYGGTLTVTQKTEFTIYIRVSTGVTVSNFTFYPMLRLASVEDSVYEPYTGGISSPNPDYPQEIVNIGDAGSVDVGVYGKNLLGLLPDKLVTKHGLTGTINADGSITANGTPNKAYATCYFATISLEPGTYFVSGGVATDKVYAQVGITDSEGNTKHYSNRSFVIDGTESDIMFTVQIGNHTDTISNYTVYPMLNLGSTALPFEPYKAKQTFTISTPNGLPGIQVNDSTLATYTDADGQMWCADEVDFGRGVYVQRVGESVFDGDENWYKNDPSDVSNYLYWALLTTNPVSSLCNKLTEKPLSKVNGGNTPDNMGYCIYTSLGSAGKHIYINLGTMMSENTVGSLKTVLTENPITIHYILATPIEKPLSDEELEAFAALYTNNPNTTVMNDKNASMTMMYYSKRYDEAVDFIINKINDNRADIRAIKGVTEVTLLANSWSGSAAPYTQTVDVSGITEDDNPLLVSALYDGASLTAQKAYSKAFGIVSSGVATVTNGSVTFNVYKLPEVDIVVGLKGV